MADKPAKSLVTVRDELRAYLSEDRTEFRDMLLLDLSAFNTDIMDTLLSNVILLRSGKNLSWGLQQGFAHFFNINKGEDWSNFNIPDPDVGDDSQPIATDFFKKLAKGDFSVSIPIGNVHEYPDIDPVLEFCRRDPNAIFHPKVAGLIRHLRVKNSKESLAKLDRVFNAYKSPDSENKLETLRKDLCRWWFEIYPYIQKLELEEIGHAWPKQTTKRNAFYRTIYEKTALMFGISKNTIRESHKVLKEIDELLDRLKRGIQVCIASNYLHNDWSFPLHYKMLYSQAFEEILLDVYGVCIELAIYKLIRKRLTHRSYLEGTFILKADSLWKDHTERFKFDPEQEVEEISVRLQPGYKYREISLREIFADLSDKYPFTRTDLKRIYYHYRGIEADLNSEYLYWEEFATDIRIVGPLKVAWKNRQISRCLTESEPIPESIAFFAMLWQDGYYDC